MNPEQAPDPGSEAHLEAYEADVEELAHHLRASPPIPRAAFRSFMRAHLTKLESDRRWPRARLRAHAAAYAGTGALLLAVAAIGLADIGPFAT